jgi:hypothetical protein
MTGKELRMFFRDLFGSRVSERLELELGTLRSNYESRITDFRTQIVDLKQEKLILANKIEQLEVSVFPTVSKVGADIVRRAQGTPKPEFGGGSFDIPEKSAWQNAQEEWQKQQEADERELKTSATAQGA